MNNVEPHNQATRPPVRRADVLSTAQLARIEALTASRDVLAAKAFLTTGAITDVADLLRTATWVMDGTDSWTQGQDAPAEDAEVER